MIEVIEYDPRWPELFAQIRDRVWPACSEAGAVAIEHIGSTSVPGLAAKPVIDLDLVIRAEADLAPVRSALARLRYRDRGDLGVPSRYAFHAPAEPAIHHNLYVCVAGSVARLRTLAAAQRYGISASTVHSLPIVAPQVVTPTGLSGRCR